MEIREIQTFLYAAKHKSFSAAARELGYSQAAVTIQIRNLEEELGVRLFDRMGRQVLLTSHGLLFHEHAVRIMKEISGAQAAVMDAGELTGTLSIGAIESISSCVLPPLMLEFHARYPKVSVSISLDSPKALLNRLGAGGMDLVYILDQQVYDPKWIKYMEQPEEILFVTSSSRKLPGELPLPLDVLLAEPFLLTEKDASYRSSLDQLLASMGKTLEPFLEIGNTDFIVTLIKAGIGYTFLPRYAVQQEIDAGTLIAVPVRDISIRGWRQIICHRDRFLTREMQAFCELAAALSPPYHR